MAAGFPITNILQILGPYAGQQLEQEVTLVFGVKKAVHKLRSNMIAIQAVFDDAERKQMENPSVKQWLHKLKDVSYEIDDVLDDWNTAFLKLQIRRGNNPSSKVFFFINPAGYYLFRQIGVRRNIAVKIKDLNERLDVIAKEKNDYSLTESNAKQYEQRKTTFIVDVQDIVGRVDDKEMLTDMLLSESSHGPNLNTISIVGMGGLGKTTLAQFAYNDEHISSYFTTRMWVCVSDPFEETRVAKAILEALTGSKPNLDELNSVMQSISKHVDGKRFLLVLDDVWCEENDWCKRLHDSLKTGLPGSKILITTRKEGVAYKALSKKIRLGVLADKESWDLFKRVAYYDWDDKECEDTEDIGHEIVKKCMGLPLAVKTIGSFLRMKKSRRDWLNVLEGEKWKVTEKEGVFPLLMLSYNDLSPALRQCFLYCGIFPKDFKIERDYIINLWMAQGYLMAENNTEMEEVGDEYFNDLAMRSFFQDFHKGDGNMIEHCKMHDIVHDFARSLTNNECLAMEVNDFEKQYSGSSSHANIRHLMIMFDMDEFSVPISIGNFKSLRTLKFNQLWGLTSTSFDKSFDKVIEQLTSLRTLDLSRTPIRKLSRKVGKLLHLRYLNLEDCDYLEELPDNIWDLCNLLVLNVNWCSNLKRLPGGLRKVINLRQLKLRCSHTYTLPKGVDGLTGLRYLDEFVVSSEIIDKNEVSTLSDLMNLNQLRGSLEISWLGNVREVSEAKKANVNKKEHLTRLSLQFRPPRSEVEEREMEERRRRDVEVLEALQPHPNLQFLSIEFYLGIRLSPRWTSMNNLKDLQLGYCPNCQVLPTLGKLPSLESLRILYLGRVTRVGSEFLGTSVSFPKLKILKFEKMEQWEEWDYNSTQEEEEGEEEEGSSDIYTTSTLSSIMPCLEELRTLDCPRLKSVPDHILHTPSLKKFYIIDSQILKERLIQYFQGDTLPSWLIYDI